MWNWILCYFLHVFDPKLRDFDLWVLCLVFRLFYVGFLCSFCTDGESILERQCRLKLSNGEVVIFNENENDICIQEEDTTNGLVD